MTETSPLHRPDIWTDAVASYEVLAEPQTRQFARIALDLSGGVKLGERMLDVAAGTGALALEAAAAGARVLATDFSPGMVTRLAARLTESGFDQAGSDARVMDGQALDLPDEGFDAAFSIFGVMLFPDWERGLRELHRVVRPGGRVVMATWARAQGAGPALLFDQAWREAFPERDPLPFPTGLEALRTENRLAAAMQVAGSREVRVEAVTRDWEIQSADWMADNAHHLFRQFPGWASLDDPDRGRVRERLRAAGGDTPDKPLIVQSHALIGIGQR